MGWILKKVLARCSLTFLVGATGMLSLSVGYATTTEEDWEVASSEWRLVVKPEQDDQPGSLGLNKYLLPVPAKSLKVYANGKPVGFRLYDNGMLVLRTIPKVAEYRIYLDVSPVQKEDQWGESSELCPPEEALSLVFYQWGNLICTEQEFIQRQREAIARNSVWQLRYATQRGVQLWLTSQFNSNLLQSQPRPVQQIKNQQREYRRIVSRRVGERRSQYQVIRYGKYLTARDEVNQYLQRQRQLKNHLQWTINESVKLAKRYEQVMIDAPTGAQQDLLGIVTRKNPRKFAASELQLLRLPPDISMHYSCRFSGMLQITEEDDYEFELISNALTIVLLDGEQVALHLGNGAGEAETIRFRQRLTAGSHFLEVFNRLNKGSGQLTLSMRQGSTGDFRLLRYEDFEPAPPLALQAIESRSGRKLPIIERQSHYQLHTGKQSKAELVQFRVKSQAEEVAFTWNGSTPRTVFELPRRFALPTRGGSGLIFLCDRNNPLALLAEGQDREAVAVSIPAEVFLKLWIPETLYDDEVVEGQVEIRSKLPEAIDLEYQLHSESETAQLLQPTRKRLELPAKTDERFDQFSPDIMLKLPLEFRGATLSDPETWEVELAMPGLQFDRQRFQVVPVGANLELKASSRGLVNAKGDPIILLLHRPTLAEMRSGELWRKLDEKLHVSHKLMVIAEDYGVGKDLFSSHLERRLTEVGSLLEFVAIPSDSGNSLPELIASSWSKVAETDATSVLVILPCPAHLTGVEPWQRDRYIAALIERIKLNPNIRQVILSALPGLPEQQPEYDKLLDTLRHQAREYGIDALNLELLLSDLLSQAGAYQVSGRDGEYETHPVGVVAEIADILYKALGSSLKNSEAE